MSTILPKIGLIGPAVLAGQPIASHWCLQSFPNTIILKPVQTFRSGTGPIGPIPGVILFSTPAWRSDSETRHRQLGTAAPL